MNSDYYQKYQKYKLKYLALKQIYEGGKKNKKIEELNIKEFTYNFRSKVLFVKYKIKPNYEVKIEGVIIDKASNPPNIIIKNKKYDLDDDYDISTDKYMNKH
jgi:hypothetical protein